MKLIYILSGLLCLASIGACVKDKGTYTYKNGHMVTIKMPTSSYTAFIGDTLRLDAIRTYADSTDTTSYDYAWYVDGRLYSTQKALVYVGVATDLGAKYVTYYVTDKKSGITYSLSSPFFITVSSRYQSGWGILYEQNGKSELGHVLLANGQYLDYRDLYKQNNNGEELGATPVKIRDYLVAGGRGMYVLQRGGQGPVELDASSLKKKLVMAQSFLGGMPAGFAPVDMAFYQNAADLMMNDNGDLYARFTNGSLPFTVPFMSTPLTIKGGLKVGDILDSWSRTSTFAFFYDKLNKRLLRSRINVLTTGGGLTIDTLIRPVTPYPADYTPLNNLGSWEYVWGGTFNDAATSMDGALLLRNPADQQLYYESFNYLMPNGSEQLTPKKRILFPGNAYVTAASKYVAVKTRNYLFFTGGSNNEKLYYYDAQSETIVKPYATLSGRINVITASDDGQQLAVGLDDGTFVLYDISNATMINGVSNELHRYSGLGRIADIIVKGGNMN